MTYLRIDTPLEDHLEGHGLLVKREDLSCPPPGPPFSKTRGVYAHVKARVEAGVKLFGVLDTVHSQGGLAVAHACFELGVGCVDYWPRYKANALGTLGPVQYAARELGAEVVALVAGRSAVLYHQAKRRTEALGGYMMPNALRLPESVEETALELGRTLESADPQTLWHLETLPWLVSASSGTLAGGVLRGLHRYLPRPPKLILHMGYSRSRETALAYVRACGGVDSSVDIVYVDEGYEYKDTAKPRALGRLPPWPANEYYDRKAVYWWQNAGRQVFVHAVLWNIG